MRRKFSIFVVWLMIFSLLSQSGVLSYEYVSAEDNSLLQLKFDFGGESTPVADGYLQVTDQMLYDGDRGYGLNKVPSGFRDQGEPDALKRDFILMNDTEFLVDLPNGLYGVLIITGAQTDVNRTAFSLEGGELIGGERTGAGEFKEYQATVFVSDGQLNIYFTDEWARINAVEIRQLSSELSDEDLIVHYDMSHADGKLIDVTNNGFDAEYVGFEDEDFIQEDGQTILNFTGDHSKYVKLPEGIINSEEFTIETKFSTNTAAHHWLYTIGTIEASRPTNYVFFNPNSPSGEFRFGIMSNGTEQLFLDAAINHDEYNTVITSFAEGKITFFLNGEYVGSLSHDYSVMEILEASIDPADDFIGYIGKSLYTADPAFVGKLAEFKVYDSVLSAPEVSGLEATEVSLGPDIFVTLSWLPEVTAVKYNVYRKQAGETDFTLIGETTDSTFTDDTAELGDTYIYAVSLVNELGIESDKSEELSITMSDDSIAIPPAPTGLELVDVAFDAVTLAWDEVEEAVEYHIYRSKFNQEDYPNYEVPYTRVGVTKDTQFTDDTIFTNRSFYYLVYAVNEGGMSEPSEVLETPATNVLVRQMEKLNRALVAVDTDDGIYIGWKMLGTDPDHVTFDIYRDGEKINDEPISSSTNYLDKEGTIDSRYRVRVNNGSGDPLTEEVGVWSEQYLSIPLNKPEGGVTPDGVEYTYSANDASVGDVDGDGNYEIILKWDPSNSKDNAHSGYTGNVYIDAYTLEGEQLWRIDLGRNIRAGAHYTQFLVYDFDGDGKAEVVMKTADGTVDGVGNVIGDPDADYRNSSGYILDGPEYLTVFSGETGEAMETIDYYPPRGNVCDWGDCYGNRVDRFLAGVAYLDGERPSFVMARGYYTRTVLAAYNWRDGKITQKWVFDSDEPGNEAYAGQGNHSLSVADVDGDGKDEIIYGAAVIDHDGTGLYSTGWGHGDANHVSDLNPNRPGLEIYETYEDGNSPVGYAIRDAETGELLWGVHAGTDVGRGMAADIDPRHDGAELWASESWDGSSGLSGLYTVEGKLITEKTPQSINHAIWWDGDLLRELLDHDFDENVDPHGVGKIEKWNWETEELETIFVPEGTRSNNWTKGNPSLQADIFGDWREEVIWPSADSTELCIYTTTDLTEHRIYTLMHDPTYRLGVVWQNVAYNQPPHTGFFLGHGMDPAPTPIIDTGDEAFELEVSKLEALIKKATSLLNNDEYTEKSLASLQAAITAAREAMVTISSVEELEEALSLLQTAINNLEEVADEEPEQVDTSTLQELIDYAKSLLSARQFTTESSEALLAVIQQVEENLADIQSASELEGAIAMLQAAIDALVEEEIEDPNEEEKDDSDVDEEEEADDTTTESDRDQDGDGDVLPKTATIMYTMLLAGLMILILGSAILLYTKKKKTSANIDLNKDH